MYARFITNVRQFVRLHEQGFVLFLEKIQALNRSLESREAFFKARIIESYVDGILF